MVVVGVVLAVVVAVNATELASVEMPSPLAQEIRTIAPKIVLENLAKLIQLTHKKLPIQAGDILLSIQPDGGSKPIRGCTLPMNG